MFDKNFDIHFDNLEGLPPEPSLLKRFNKRSFSYDDFFEILSTHTNTCAPGLNGIPYKVYKTVPKFFQPCFKKCEIPIQWQIAQQIYMPKFSSISENKLSDFRPIALLNVEGKPFFSLVSKHLETHLIHSNKFRKKSIQKECTEKFPGCWEYLSMVWHVLKETRAQKLLYDWTLGMLMGPSPTN